MANVEPCLTDLSCSDWEYAHAHTYTHAHTHTYTHTHTHAHTKLSMYTVQNFIESIVTSKLFS